MKPELIIFDFDGTIADTTAIILETYRRTIAELKAEHRSDKACRATIGIPLRDGFRKLYPKFNDVELDKCVATYRRIYSSLKDEMRPRLYPGVIETLDELKRHNVMMAIASSRSKESLLEYCAKQEILNYFDEILGADDVCHAKPAPEAVLKIMKKMNARAENTIVIGDMPVDIAMGRSASCMTVGVEYGNSTPDALEAAGADIIVDFMPTMLPAIGLAE